MAKLTRLLYKLRLKRRYADIDRLRYLKRLGRRKSRGDDWSAIYGRGVAHMRQLPG